MTFGTSSDETRQRVLGQFITSMNLGRTCILDTGVQRLFFLWKIRPPKVITVISEHFATTKLGEEEHMLAVDRLTRLLKVLYLKGKLNLRTP